MRLDHVSYVSSHEQVSDVLNRIGSQIGTAFVDGGIHPKFGTRNFTAPLLNGQYIEVVCPLDHPATDTTPFGRAVKNIEKNGGGWFTWVLATENISEIENIFSRESVIGLRSRPNGSLLQWKQLGVLETLNDPQMPFFIQWITDFHPSEDGSALASISSINISGSSTKVNKILENTPDLESIKIEWTSPELNEGFIGITSVDFMVGKFKVTVS